ncbi:MAG: 4-(cytidine 5'-diphospho)-2-C-methyl-D-erythritol kinase [Ruminococcaceae bacterium]|nr:4-(cytidine 5'-diphospho)-2-C-methyl-D-erythritol kinase [Oscillospiraceae bacterium]
MKLKACAKINLTLDVLGKREDGYHLIDSVFQSVSLCDIVSVEKSDVISVVCTDTSICDKSNIAYKAAQSFFEHTGVIGGADIVIEKHIPLASGMGGGSADAAAVIVALDKLYKTNLSQQQLCEIGLSVGADVPFCIVGGTARVCGIGEQMKKLSDMPDCAMLLIKHGEKMSTADMYKRVDAFPQQYFYTQPMVNAMNNGDLNAICKNVFNAFSSVCKNDILINDIKQTNACSVSLSGSGPTVFAIYSDIAHANAAKTKLEQKGYSPIVAVPSKNGIIE